MGEKETDKAIWEQMRASAPPIAGTGPASHHPTIPKILLLLILFVSVTYVVYTLKLVSTSRACNHLPFATHTFSVNASASASALLRRQSRQTNPEDRTALRHVVFGIAASAKLWNQRKNYIKLWYRPREMCGVVWLDQNMTSEPDEDSLPPVRVSGDTARFKYTNRQGHQSAIRISRIVSETLRLGLKDVR